MGQVTIYLEEEIEIKMIKAAESANLSKSKWIARLIQEKIAKEWPQSVVDMALVQSHPTYAKARVNNGDERGCDCAGSPLISKLIAIIVALIR